MADSSPPDIEIPVLVKTPAAPDGTISGVGRFASVFGKAFSAIKSHPWVVATLALVRFGADAVAAWRRQDTSVGTLNQALVNQGIYTRGLSDQYQKTAEAIQRDTAYGDEEILEAQAALQPFMKGKVISERLMRAVVDFASKNGMDLSRAADLVGRTIGTGTNALQRSGIAIDDNATGNERMAQVLAGLEGTSKGQAAAAVQGTGALRQMRHALNRVMEMVGKALAPFVVAVAQSVTELAGKMTQVVGMIDLEMIGAALYGTLETAAKVFISAMSAGLSGLGALMSDNSELVLKMFREGKRDVMTTVLAGRKRFAAERDKMARERTRRSETQAKKIEKQMGEAADRRGRAASSGSRDREDILKTRSEKEAIEEITRQRLRGDRKFIALNESIAAEKDVTKQAELQRQKSEMWEDELHDTQVRHQERVWFFARISDKETIKFERDGLSALGELKNSKYAPQVLIGKAASILQMGLNTSRAIAGAWKALSGVPPPFGQILAGAVTAFLAWFGAEQALNIADSSMDKPGKIGLGDLTLEDFIEGVSGQFDADIIRGVTMTIETLLEASADVQKKLADDVHKWLEDKLGGFGDAIGSGLEFATAIDSFLINALGDIIGSVGEVAAKIAEKIGNAIVDVLEGIGDAIGDAFDWLFAEGGVVTAGSQGSVVTPLKQAGLNLRKEVSVTIRGGLIPSQQEAKRIAGLVAKEMGA